MTRYPTWAPVPDYFDGREVMDMASGRKALVVDAEDEAALKDEILKFYKKQRRRWKTEATRALFEHLMLNGEVI